MTNEEYEKQIIELKRKIKILETERDVLNMKLEYAIGCFDSLKDGLQQVIEATDTAKNGIT